MSENWSCWWAHVNMKGFHKLQEFFLKRTQWIAVAELVI
jgi:hypothetical protein